MNEEKKLEIKNLIVTLLPNFTDKSDLVYEIIQGYIFGKYASSEHYTNTQIMDLVYEVEAGVIVEPVIDVEVTENPVETL